MVSLHDMCIVNQDGTVSQGEILLPPGKIPFVLSQDDVSYYHYMDGDGFAQKLIVDENGGSLMEQTTDGWVFSMAEIMGQVQQATDDLKTLEGNLDDQGGSIDALQNAVSTLETLTSYVRITTEGDEPCIELGNHGAFKVRITNSSIDFMDGTSIPAYINNQSLKIDKAEVENELAFGKFAFKERDNGNMGLIWKG